LLSTARSASKSGAAVSTKATSRAAFNALGDPADVGAAAAPWAESDPNPASSNASWRFSTALLHQFNTNDVIGIMLPLSKVD
jgi:hypothetical protein